MKQEGDWQTTGKVHAVYEPPQALRLGKRRDGTGSEVPCQELGSSAIGPCSIGFTATTTCLQSGSVAVLCDPSGSDPTG
jgi:hypothetical protein